MNLFNSKQAQNGSILLFVLILMGILSWLCIKTSIQIHMDHELMELAVLHEQYLNLLDSYMLYGSAFCHRHLEAIQTSKHKEGEPIIFEFISRADHTPIARGSLSIMVEQEIIFIKASLHIGTTVLLGETRMRIILNEAGEKTLKTELRSILAA